MSWPIVVSATPTGGTTLTLKGSGQQPGKSAYVTPTSTYLAPEKVSLTSSGGNVLAQDPGVVKSGLKIELAQRTTEEGCCSVMAGGVILDLGIRWNLNQPESLVDRMRILLTAMIQDDEFWTFVKTGVQPG